MHLGRVVYRDQQELVEQGLDIKLGTQYPLKYEFARLTGGSRNSNRLQVNSVLSFPLTLSGGLPLASGHSLVGRR